MTTFDDYGELDELDDVASAIVDGEATAEELARLQTDPALQSRVNEFRLLAGSIASPVTPVTEQQRDRAIDVALTHAPVTAAPPSESSRQLGAPVASLDRRRARRADRSETRNRFLQAAAVIAIVGIGGIGVWGLTGGGSFSDETASMVSDTSADSVERESSFDTSSTGAPASASEALAVPVPNFEEGASDDAAGDIAAEADDAEATEENAMDDAMEEEAMIEDAAEEDAMAADTMDEEAAMMQEAVEAEAEGAKDSAAADAPLQASTVQTATAWIDGFLPESPVFAERSDTLGLFATLDELTATSIDTDSSETLTGPDCPTVIAGLNNATSTLAATALITSGPVPQEVVIVRGTAGELTAIDRATCEVLLHWQP